LLEVLVSDAVTALREALAVTPNNVPLRIHLGRTLLKSGRADEALSEFRTALSKEGDRTEARIGAGSAALALGRWGEAVEHWFSVRADLENEDLRELARAAVQAGRRDEARIAYDELLARDPSFRDLGLDRALRMVVVNTPQGATPQPLDDLELEPEADPPARARITFEDVGGLEPLKERLRMDIIYPLQRPDLFKAYGKKVGGGVLLYGPPGCGKTHLARAAAGECGVNFISVEIQQVLDMWLGESEKRLHQIFERARDESPTIMFFDEMEAIGAARHQIRQGPGRRMVNQLLAEMDGVGSRNDNILVLGATNAPWDVDPALRRPGRFDRVIFVPPPDVAAREAILRIAFRDRPIEDLDYALIARRTPRFSGADLAHLASVASERALTEALHSGVVRAIQTSDVLYALDKVRSTTVEWMETAKRFVTYANQAGIYDEVARYMDKDAAG
jgi:transitional endoplasmic reticulum ATPase